MEQFYELWLKSQKNEKSDDVASQSNKENGKQIHMPTDYAEVTVSTPGWCPSPLLPGLSFLSHLLQNLAPSPPLCPPPYLHLLSVLALHCYFKSLHPKNGFPGSSFQLWSQEIVSLSPASLSLLACDTGQVTERLWGGCLWWSHEVWWACGFIPVLGHGKCSGNVGSPLPQVLLFSYHRPAVWPLPLGSTETFSHLWSFTVLSVF